MKGPELCAGWPIRQSDLTSTRIRLRSGGDLTNSRPRSRSPTGAERFALSGGPGAYRRCTSQDLRRKRQSASVDSWRRSGFQRSGRQHAFTCELPWQGDLVAHEHQSRTPAADRSVRGTMLWCWRLLPGHPEKGRALHFANAAGSTRLTVSIRSIDLSNDATLLTPVVSALATR